MSGPAADAAPNPVAKPKEPGWYPDRLNPNDQNYWDGTAWSGHRRWTAAKGWLEVGDAPKSGAGRSPRISANPYVQSTPAESRVVETTSRRSSGDTATSLGLVLMLASGILLMVGSVTTWINANVVFGQLFHLNASVTGVDPGVSNALGINGYATFIAGIVIVVLAGASMAGDDGPLRQLTVVAGLTSLGLAIYILVRVMQKINEASAHGSPGLGVGVILLVVGGALAALIAIGRLMQYR